MTEAYKARKDTDARYRAQHPDRVAEYQRRAKYGLEPAEYQALLERQGGVCAICRRPETAVLRGRNKALCVDHDHVTDRVRGLLCFRCNLAIGYLSDDPERARAAADYLEKT